VLEHSGFARVEDFHKGQDRLELPNHLNFSDLSLIQQGNSTAIRLSGHTLAQLHGIKADTLTARDFVESNPSKFK